MVDTGGKLQKLFFRTLRHFKLALEFRDPLVNANRLQTRRRVAGQLDPIAAQRACPTLVDFCVNRL
jgi:hypothetical protein